MVIRSGYYTYGILAFIVGIHLFLLFRLVFFPYPELFVYSYLTDQGLLPYKQIFDQHFPGLMFFPVNYASLGMTTAQIARYWHFVVVGLTHLLLFTAAKAILKSERIALVANILYLAWQPFLEGYVLWIDLFIPLFLLPAFYLLYRFKNEKGLFFSGFFIGLAFLFKQVVAPLAALLVFIIFIRSKSVKDVLTFFAGVGIPLFFLLIYILRIDVWQDFVYWTLTFNLTTFAQMGRKHMQFSDIIKIAPTVGLSFVLLSYLLFRSKKKNTILLLGTFLIGSLFFAFARFDFIHLQPALPFAILTIVYAVIRIPKNYLIPGFMSYFVFTAYLLLPFYIFNLGNKIFFFGEFERNLVAEVQEVVQPKDTIFAFGTTPHLYQLTQTLPPGRIFVFQFPWFMVEAEDRVLLGIINDPPKVIVRDKSASTGGLNLIEHMPNINKHVEDNYYVVDKIETAEILVPK